MSRYTKEELQQQRHATKAGDFMNRAIEGLPLSPSTRDIESCVGQLMLAVAHLQQAYFLAQEDEDDGS